MRSSFALALAAVLCAAALVSARSYATITVYPRHGEPSDGLVPPTGPGVVVMGGGQDVDDAFRWMQARTADANGAGGDVVVLRDPDTHVGRDDAYAPYLLSLAKFNSVQTVVLADPVTTAELAQAAALVDRAEAVFFGGGDQRHYVLWRGALLDAVQRVYDRRGVVGGTSAGGALWGEIVNDAIGEYRHGSTTSANAIADPFEPSITFTSGLFRIPGLAGAITDSHFHARDRFGRLAAFVARIAGGGIVGAPRATGLGVDEDSALLVDERGVAMLALYAPGRGGAWIVRGGTPHDLAAGHALSYDVAVTRLDAVGQRFDLASGCGDGASYDVSIDGTKTPAYAPVDPYGAPSKGGTCGELDAGPPPAMVDAAAQPDSAFDGGAAGDTGGAVDTPAYAQGVTGCTCTAGVARQDSGAWLLLLAFVAAALRRNKDFMHRVGVILAGAWRTTPSSASSSSRVIRR